MQVHRAWEVKTSRSGLKPECATTPHDLKTVRFGLTWGQSNRVSEKLTRQAAVGKRVVTFKRVGRGALWKMQGRLHEKALLSLLESRDSGPLQRSTHTHLPAHVASAHIVIVISRTDDEQALHSSALCQQFQLASSSGHCTVSAALKCSKTNNLHCKGLCGGSPMPVDRHGGHQRRSQNRTHEGHHET